MKKYQKLTALKAGVFWGIMILLFIMALIKSGHYV